jgi:cell division protein FtsW (lipid II flippase)
LQPIAAFCPRDNVSRLHRPRPRLTELALLFFPATMAITGFALIALAKETSVHIAWPDIRLAAGLAGILLIGNIAMTVADFSGDQLLFPVVSVLTVIGFVTIHRLQPALTERDDRLANIAERHSLYIGAGLVLAVLTAFGFNRWDLLKRYKYTALAGCILMLAVTFVFGTPINGARLWITIGPVQAQPSEFVKIGLVLFMASYLEEKKDLISASWRVGPFNLPPLPYLLPMLLMWGASLLVLVVENDLGSALLLFGIFLIMVYTATGRLFYVGAGLITFAGACWFAYQAFDRIGLRVQNWLDPWRDPLVGGYQPVQSEYAFASGGILGRGIGHGQAWRIPEVQTDYIFSAIGEELGLVGTLAIVALFVVILARGFAIGINADDDYTRLVAIGLTSTIALQALIILGGVVRLIPLTGITLPFVSAGGSSLMVNFLIVGLLLNLSRKKPNSS